VKYDGNVSFDPPQLAENPIPEPESLVLLFAGLLGWLAFAAPRTHYKPVPADQPRRSRKPRNASLAMMNAIR
jgi:hypothetical protein